MLNHLCCCLLNPWLQFFSIWNSLPRSERWSRALILIYREDYYCSYFGLGRPPLVLLIGLWALGWANFTPSPFSSGCGLLSFPKGCFFFKDVRREASLSAPFWSSLSELHCLQLEEFWASQSKNRYSHYATPPPLQRPTSSQYYFTPGQRQTLAWQAEGVDEVRV